MYKNVHPDLADCDPTIAFTERISNLIKVMMTRTPADALRMDNHGYDVIAGFIEYLDQWEQLTEQNNYKFFTAQTCFGLKLSLRATLELLKFLTEEEQFKFLMTSRINQVALERFFSLVRGICGSNDHPDSIIFGQMFRYLLSFCTLVAPVRACIVLLMFSHDFRLLSMYSLVKTRKGSNVDDKGHLLSTLLTVTDTFGKKETVSDEIKGQWHKALDSIVEEGLDSSSDDESKELMELPEDRKEKVFRALIAFISGYFVRHSQKWNKCSRCHQSNVSDKLNQNHPDFELINFLTLGYLKYPSVTFLTLLQQLETIVMRVVAEESIHSGTFVNITSECLENVDNFLLIGCDEHKATFTTAVITRYLSIRADFLAKGFNNANDANREETRQKRKFSKYY